MSAPKLWSLLVSGNCTKAKREAEIIQSDPRRSVHKNTSCFVLTWSLVCQVQWLVRAGGDGGHRRQTLHSSSLRDGELPASCCS